MAEEEKKKNGIDLHWPTLLTSDDDEEPPPELVVSINVDAAGEAELPPPLPPTPAEEEDDEKSASKVALTSDREIEEELCKQQRNLKNLGHKIKDGGEKLRRRIELLKAEKRRRQLVKPLNDNGCEKQKQSKSRHITSAPDDIEEETPSSVKAQQSTFTTIFSKKIEGNHADTRTVNAFENEISSIRRCGSRNLRPKFPERHKSALPSRHSPYRCPTNLSVHVDKQNLSHGDHKGHRSTRSSPNHKAVSADSFMDKRKDSRFIGSKNTRRRNGQAFVLVDEEEPELIEMMEVEDEVDKWSVEEEADECMKDCMVYYPSRDAPESIEICYSDMQCLAPEAYLSSTIMSFYSRHLQELASGRERRGSDYHFFNTYFYNKLKEALSKKNDTESSFLKLRRWWKGVNIFQKAYIFLPVHENLHWSLVIICIPDKEDELGAFILHLDSLELHDSASIFKNIKSFLIEEWKCVNQEESPLDLPISDRVWKNLSRRIEEKPIQVPQQRNDYDCGLFVLYFMERFISEAPQRLKRKDLTKFGRKWFKPEDASGLRPKIKKLLMEEFRREVKDNSASAPEPSPTLSPQKQKCHQPIDCSNFILL